MCTFKKWRESRGLKQSELAVLLKCSQGYVSMLEDGRRVPSYEMIRTLVGTYGCLPADLGYRVVADVRVEVL